MADVIRPCFGTSKTEMHDVRRFYGETNRYRVGLVACPTEPYGATLKVIMCTVEDGEVEAVATVLDGPGAEAEADRIGVAVLRALQTVERKAR